MAEKRMFARSIVSSDAFITMSPTAQCLYFQLSMSADDEGVANNPISIMRTVGAKEDDLKELVEKKFLIQLESGIYVIKHWKINNSIRADRKRDSNYKKELSTLDIQENGAYTADRETKADDQNTINGCQTVAECPSNDSQKTAECQPSIGKDSIDKDRLGKTRLGKIRQEEISLDSDKVSIDTANTADSDFLPPDRPESERLPFPEVIPNTTQYAQTVFDLYAKNSLPCCKGNFISFIQRDFKIGLEGTHALHLHSDEVIAAVNNYCKVIQLAREGKSWFTSEMAFFNFCKDRGQGKPATILSFLPDNFSLDYFLAKKNDSPGGLPDDRIRL